MRRTKLLLLSLLCGLTAAAQTEGYYRVQNVAQERYIAVMDDYGSINFNTTTADMDALRTIKGFDKVVSSPATIIYFKKLGNDWDLQCQGTSTYSIIEHAISIRPLQNGYYSAYAQRSGTTLYLGDQYVNTQLQVIPDTGKVVTNSNMTREWYLRPVEGDYYFGLTPTVTAGSAYYQTFYASFPFTFASSGMEAYTVKKIDNAKAAVVIEPLTAGVSAATPVIVKCASEQPSGNKLTIGSGSGSATINLLKGVYFCNPVNNPKHRDVVAYDSQTMRVLGTSTDGKLAFVKSSSLQYIPSNTAYITVTADAPAELKVYTQSEYDALPTVKRGDIDGDGKVSGSDLVVMVNMILNIRQKTAAADLSGDGDVTGQDYVMLVNLILGGAQ